MYVLVRAKSLQSCPTLCDPVDCSLPGCSIHGILHARILEWVVVPSSNRCLLVCVCVCVFIYMCHSSTLAWKIPWAEEPGRQQSMGSRRVRHDWTPSLSLFTFMLWRRKWQPTPVFCLENPRDGGARWAAVYGVAQSRTQLKWLSRSSMYENVLFLRIYSLKYLVVKDSMSPISKGLGKSYIWKKEWYSKKSKCIQLVISG